jgi:hypothetical protein
VLELDFGVDEGEQSKNYVCAAFLGGHWLSCSGPLVYLRTKVRTTVLELDFGVDFFPIRLDCHMFVEGEGYGV